MAPCGFAAVTVNHCCRSRSEMWSNAKIQKLQIFSEMFTTFDSFLSVQFDHANFGQFLVNFRSSLQS